MNRTFLGTVAAFLLFSTTGLAQVEQPSQVTVQGTALITKESTADTTSTTQRSTKSGGLLVGYSYQFNSWAGVEGNYGYTRNTQNYFASIGQSSIQADMHELTGSFVAHIPVRIPNIRPYALAGAGALIFDPTDRYLLNGVDRQTKPAFVYGGGFNFDLTPHFCVRGEKRRLVYKGPDFSLNKLNLDKVNHLSPPSI